MLTDCNFIVGFLVFSVLVSFGQVACLLVKSLAGCKPLIGWLARLRAIESPNDYPNDTISKRKSICLSTTLP